MKLLYITNGINGSGGLERVLSIKASLLAEQYDYEVSILVLNNSQKNLFYDFSPKIQLLTISVGGNPFQYIKSYTKGIKQIVSKIQPDIISVCDDGLKGFFIPQFLKTKAKIIYERHVSKSIEITGKQSMIQKLWTKTKWVLMNNLGKSFSHFIVLTQQNTVEWEELNNLIIIPNPLSFYPQTVSSLHEKNIICVGKISYQKGQDLLLGAWNILSTQYADWHLNLYGKENISLINKEQLINGVSLYPATTDIQTKYLESSIYVMSSRLEGFGMVLIEAMACGLPCISFDCPYGPSDIITNGVNGFLIPSGDIKQLAEKIVYLIENKDERVKMGYNARITAKKYLPENIIPIWDKLFKELVNEKTNTDSFS